MPNKYTRRRFFPMLLQELAVTMDTAKGKPGFALGDMSDLPDDQLRGLIPIMNPAHKIFTEKGFVCSRTPGKDEDIIHKLFPISTENLAVFNRLNGRHTLSEIGEMVARDLKWEQPDAFAHTRKLFCLLVSARVCLPKNPPPSD